MLIASFERNPRTHYIQPYSTSSEDSRFRQIVMKLYLCVAEGLLLFPQQTQTASDDLIERKFKRLMHF